MSFPLPDAPAIPPHGPESASASASAPQEPHALRSCVTCRRRKVRCNKRCPCSNCLKAGIDCVFPPPGRAPRKPKQRPHDAELLSRLRRLEGVIETLNERNTHNSNNKNQNNYNNQSSNSNPTSNSISNPTPAPSASIANTPSPQQLRRSGSVASSGTEPCPMNPSQSPVVEPEVCPYMFDANRKPPLPNLENEFGRLVIDEGRSRYVSNRFWTSLGDEIEELQDILDPPSSDEDEYESPESSPAANHDGFVFGFYSLSHSLRNYFPLQAHIPILWNIYLANVAPILPIVHRPSAQKLFTTATQQPESLDKNSEALFLSMVLVSVVSMSQEDCVSLLDDDRDALVKRYRFAVEQALARANFLNTQSLSLVQALAIFVVGVRREDDTKFAWSMSALVLRQAQGIGLHRDGTNFGLKPFETEMRRRLWWHICFLDIRSAEDHGTDPQIHERMYDTRLPLNINDDDIAPDMVEPPPERVGCTDMTFCLVRCDIIVALRRVSYNCPNAGFPGGNRTISPENCSRFIQAMSKRVEEKYLKYCDTNVPIQWVSATVARLILMKLWLVVHHPLTGPNRKEKLSDASRESLFKTSIEVAEFALLLTVDKNTRGWSWMFVTNMQWHAFAFILSELCVRPICPVTDRAWLLVSTLYEGWAHHAKQRRGMLWRPLSRLVKRAAAFRAKQQEELRAQFGPNPAPTGAALLPFGAGSSGLHPLPRIPEPPSIPTPAQMEMPSQMSSGGMEFPDLRMGPMDVMREMFPEVDFLSDPTPQYSSNVQPMAAVETPDVLDEFMAPSMEAPMEPETGTSNLNWEEWNRVMHDFQMDMREAQTENPMGNMPNSINLSEWYPLEKFGG